MSFVDILILIITFVIVFSIIFFSFIRPKMRGQKIICHNCPVSKKGKRLLKNYKNRKL